MGTADLKSNFSSGRKDLNVSTYQMCILMLFNKQSSLSYRQIQEETDIPVSALRRHLLSLCTPKIKILSRESEEKTIGDEEVFSFNAGFTSKYRRLCLPLLSTREDSSDSTDGNTSVPVPQNVEEDRKHQSEASIVRILKSRRSITHSDLVLEVYRQMANRFVPSSQFVKKRIESLIERGLNPDLSQLNPNLSQLNPNMSQFNPNLSQFNPNVSQLNSNLSQFNPNLSQLNPSLSQLTQTCHNLSQT